MTTKITVQQLLAGLKVDDNGNVSMTPDEIEKLKAAGSTYNKDYAERSRHALGILKSRHVDEYKFYLEALKDDDKDVVEKMTMEGPTAGPKAGDSNNRGGPNSKSKSE